MKIAFVVTAQTHEGPLKVVKTLIEGLVRQKHACMLLYLENREELDLPCDKQKICYWQPIDLSEYDIVHSHGLKPDFFVWLHLMRNKPFSFLPTILLSLKTSAGSMGALWAGCSPVFFFG